MSSVEWSAPRRDISLVYVDTKWVHAVAMERAHTNAWRYVLVGQGEHGEEEAEVLASDGGDAGTQLTEHWR